MTNRYEKYIENIQQDLVEYYEGGYTIKIEDSRGAIEDSIYELKAIDPQVGNRKYSIQQKNFGYLPKIKAVIVGLDIREYSSRSDEVQFLLSMFLHLNITKALNVLRQSSILPSFVPRIIQQTGDGALVVFTLWDDIDASTLLPGQSDLSKFVENRNNNEDKYLQKTVWQAISFVFTLNAIIHNNNVRKGFEFKIKSDHKSMYPIECRYSLSYDTVLPLKDINGILNCAGNGMVTCCRIMSTDHGSHFLIQQELMDALDKYGGLIELGASQWGHRLHWAALDSAKVKKGIFRYSDVFGFYHDGPILRALGRIHLKPKTYHIGSHDVQSLDVE